MINLLAFFNIVILTDSLLSFLSFFFVISNFFLSFYSAEDTENYTCNKIYEQLGKSPVVTLSFVLARLGV